MEEKHDCSMTQISCYFLVPRTLNLLNDVMKNSMQALKSDSHVYRRDYMKIVF